MASYSSKNGTHKTLTGTTVDTITLTKRWHSVVITNFDGTNKLYVTFDGVTAPTAAGDDTYVVPTSYSKVFKFRNAVTVIKIIGNGGAYSVEGF